MKMRLSLVAAVIALLAVGGAGLYGLRVAGQAGVGAAAVAQITCSCVFAGGRDLAACRADQPSGFEQVSAAVDTAAKTVTASVFGLVTRRATYSERYGCMLEP
jgi:hypothetical protein